MSTLTIAVRSMVVAGCLALLGGCASTVTIKYNQSANFYLFDSDPSGSPHTTTSAGEGMYMVYQITSIENTGSGAKDFNFNVAKVYASNTGEVPDQGALFAQFETAKDKLVAKGNTANHIGRLIINVNGDPNQLKNAAQPLHYLSATGESVLMIAEPASQHPTFLDPASPANLH